MRTFTYHDHFITGYRTPDGRYTAFRESNQDEHIAFYGRASRKPMSFHDECINTARLIRQTYKGMIWVPFSGGADSECVLRSFRTAEIEVGVVIMRFADGLNAYDIEYAFTACEELKIKPLILDLDLLGLWCEQSNRRCREVTGWWTGVCTLGWLTEQLDGVSIFGNGGLLTLCDDDEYYMREREPVTALYRYLMLHDRDGVPGFFQYTPEQILSWLTHKHTIKFIEDKHDIQSKNLKAFIYHDEFGATIRPKFTGYEYVDAHKLELQRHFPIEWNASALTDYHALVKHLRG